LWSGPNTGYPLNNPTHFSGNYSTADNVKVIQENFDRMMYLNTSNQLITISNSDVSGNNWAKTFYSDGELVTNGIVVIQWGRNFVFRAGHSVELRAGFETHLESEFEAFVDLCGKQDFEKVDYKKSSGVDYESNKTVGLPLEIYPNPSTGKFVVGLGLIEETGFYIINLMKLDGGILMSRERDLSSGNLPPVSFDISEFPAGIYLLEIRNTENERRVFKVVKQ